jgi:hypothetical protein
MRSFARPTIAGGALRAPARLLTLAALAATTVAGAACAGGAASAEPQAPTPASGGAAAGTAGQPAQPVAWAVGTREHVDLWLHGFALLLDDTSRVPLFRRGYREEMRTLRSRANVTTLLDAERDRLRARLATSRRLALDAQFVVLPFDSWDELRAGLEALAATGGDPRRAPDQLRAQMVAVLAQAFPTAADRDWARVFGNALQDEYTRFYHQHWLGQQRARAAVLAAADTLWQRTARPRLQRFLNNTQQQNGRLILSLPIGGEGRTATGVGPGTTVVAGFPAPGGDPAEATWVAAHELAGTFASTVVQDNVTPAEQRDGVADRYVAAAQVRAGFLVLQRLVPAQAAGYARFYLREAGLPVGADAGAALAAAFPLPAAVVASLERQLELTLGGI